MTRLSAALLWSLCSGVLAGAAGAGCGGGGATPAVAEGADAAATSVVDAGTSEPSPDADPSTARDAGGSDGAVPEAGSDGAVAEAGSARVGGPCALDLNDAIPSALVPSVQFPSAWPDDFGLELTTSDPASLGAVYTADALTVVRWNSAPSPFTLSVTLGSCPLLMGSNSQGRGLGDAKQIGMDFRLTQQKYPGFRFLAGATYVLDIKDGATAVARLVFTVPALPFAPTSVTRTGATWPPFGGTQRGVAEPATLSTYVHDSFALPTYLTSASGAATWTFTDLTQTHAHITWTQEVVVDGLVRRPLRQASWVFPL
jgi:hypothetical protein